MNINERKTQNNAKKRLPIGKEEIREALSTLKKYKQCKTNLEKRIVENEQWWKLGHWNYIDKKNPTDPTPSSAWLFNSISNKHADAMDNYPEPCVLPREENDTEYAQKLSSVLPVILEHTDFEETYSKAWWYKLKNGTGCYGVFWNPSLLSGMGDIDIRQIDILKMFWESGIENIQDSRNIFTVELEANDLLKEKYPHLTESFVNTDIDIAKYVYDDSIDTEGKSMVVDWYYKKNIGGKEIVHYCKFAGDEIIYSSENDEALFCRGFYDHGKYPFVFDVLFQDEGSPAGFGYIDVMKDVQMYIDKLNQIIIKNALQSGRRRFFISDNSGINEEEFADWSKEFVHTSGSLDERNIREINVSQLDGSIIALMNQKIDELKETSGTRDVSQGGTSGGVTAASAIAALQEAGSKLSRDMIKSSYRAFKKINYLIIELIRQFYDEPRFFRITDSENNFVFSSLSNSEIRESIISSPEGESIISAKKPIFDITVSGQKSNPFSNSAQNELAKELYNLGMFNPEMAPQALMCLEMMNFEGKAKIMRKIKNAYIEGSSGGQLISESEKNDEENYLLKGFKNSFPGKVTLDEAKRSVGL